MGSYPDPVSTFTGTSLKLNVVKTIPFGERLLAWTFTRTDPRRLERMAQPPSSRPYSSTSVGWTSRTSSDRRYSIPADRPVWVRVWYDASLRPVVSHTG